MPFGLRSAALALVLAIAPLLSTACFARGPIGGRLAEELQNTVVNISTTQTLKGAGRLRLPAPRARPSRSFSMISSTSRTKKASRAK